MFEPEEINQYFNEIAPNVWDIRHDQIINLRTMIYQVGKKSIEHLPGTTPKYHDQQYIGSDFIVRIGYDYGMWTSAITLHAQTLDEMYRKVVGYFTETQDPYCPREMVDLINLVDGIFYFIRLNRGGLLQSS